MSTVRPYSRFRTRVVRVGDLPVGGGNPIRIQSMTSSDTLNTRAVVEEIVGLHRAGAELVRLTAPGLPEAENLKSIRGELARRGVSIPLVADIHFSPRAAMIALEHCEKVRINPGNFADRKKFESKQYTDQSYEEELDRVRDALLPFLLRAKELGRSVRIGVNHGSLSDRIMGRYGDTPEGMVESALEFIRFSREVNFHDIIVSMKASHPGVMVSAYRSLVNSFIREKFDYPLHLGVTEAGEGRDGRIKSAVGIGSLLESGIGDTIRVSLTEESILEIPVARSLVRRSDALMKAYHHIPFELDYAECRPRSVRPLSPPPFGTSRSPVGLSFDYPNRPTPDTQRRLREGGADLLLVSIKGDSDRIPILSDKEGDMGITVIPEIELSNNHKFLNNIFTNVNHNNTSGLSLVADISGPAVVDEILTALSLLAENYPSTAPLLVNLKTDRPDQIEGVGRRLVRWVRERFPSAYFSILYPYREEDPFGITRAYRLLDGILDDTEGRPILIRARFRSAEQALLQASVHAGGLLLYGIGEGLIIETEEPSEPDLILSTALDLLQAVRMRIDRADFISCPSCGRTLFNIQEATRKIKERTSHLKGVRIAVMGCIVNGPGEMADADFGYVGAGPNRIHLYRGKEIVRKSIHEGDAVEALIELIKETGLWMEREAPLSVPSV